MKSLKLRDDFYWTGIIDDQLRVFDIIIIRNSVQLIILM